MSKETFKKYIVPLIRKDIREKHNKLKEIRFEKRYLNPDKYERKLKKQEAVVRRAKYFLKQIQK